MTITTDPGALARDEGASLHALVRRLFPITRSIAGPGVSETLAILQEIAPLEIRGVASGTPVLDWTAPSEWTLREAWVEAPDGTRPVDAAASNLHVVNFSTAVEATLTRDELEPHLHSLPDRPHAIPYRTGYYDDGWGFCLSHDVRRRLGPGPFHVRIDAERRPGTLRWGELVVPGDGPREILISTHLCHPSLANDNLSGLVLTARLAADRLAARERGETSPFTWRFLFVPGTIGAIAWLASLGRRVPDVAAGLVLTGLGDHADFTWKCTPDGDAWIDRLARRVLAERAPGRHAVIPFGPYGYDERQYCSPGFRLPVGRLTRGVHGTFPQYHTSDDDLDFVTPQGLEESLGLLRALARAVDRDAVWRNRSPHGEPQLGRRGLYGALGARADPGAAQMAMLWLLNRGDGRDSLLDVAERSGVAMDVLHDTALVLEAHALLERVGHGADARLSPGSSPSAPER